MLNKVFGAWVCCLHCLPCTPKNHDSFVCQLPIITQHDMYHPNQPMQKPVSPANTEAPVDMPLLLQGHVLSRLHVAKGPEAEDAEPATSHQNKTTHSSDEMGGLSGQSPDKDLQAPELHMKKMDAMPGSRHVHLARDVVQPRSTSSISPDLWSEMLKKKLGADPDGLQPHEPHALHPHVSHGFSAPEEEDSLSRVDSHSGLLGFDDVSSSSAQVLHSPHHHNTVPMASSMHQHSDSSQTQRPSAPSDQQGSVSGFRRLGRFLMYSRHLAPQSGVPASELPSSHDSLQTQAGVGQPAQQPHLGLWQRVGQSTRIMAAFKKRSSAQAEGPAGLDGLGTGGSTTSELLLLPAGHPYGGRCAVCWAWLCCRELCCALLCRAALCYAVLCCAAVRGGLRGCKSLISHALPYAVLHCDVSCSTAFIYAELHCVVLCSTPQSDLVRPGVRYAVFHGLVLLYPTQPVVSVAPQACRAQAQIPTAVCQIVLTSCTCSAACGCCAATRTPSTDFPSLLAPASCFCSSSQQFLDQSPSWENSASWEQSPSNRGQQLLTWASSC